MNLLIDSLPYPKGPMTSLQRLAEVCSRELKKIQYEEYTLAKVNQLEERKLEQAAKTDVNSNNKVCCIASTSSYMSVGSILGQTPLEMLPNTSPGYATTLSAAEEAQTTPELSQVTALATKGQGETRLRHPFYRRPRNTDTQFPVDLCKEQGRAHKKDPRLIDVNATRPADFSHGHSNGCVDATVKALDCVKTEANTRVQTEVRGFINENVNSHRYTNPYDHVNFVSRTAVRIKTHDVIDTNANVFSHTYNQVDTLANALTYVVSNTYGHIEALVHATANVPIHTIARAPGANHAKGRPRQGPRVDHAHPYYARVVAPPLTLDRDCDSSFARLGELVLRGHACPLCGRVFRLAAHVALHLRAEHGALAPPAQVAGPPPPWPSSRGAVPASPPTLTTKPSPTPGVEYPCRGVLATPPL